jgi:hypothetical protein
MNLDAAILADFRKFLISNSDEEWLIVSDYHMEKDSSYENYVSVFTVLPAGKHFVDRESVNKGLPAKLSQSTVSDSDIAFLNELNHFTFAFVSDKKFRPAAASLQAARDSIDFSLQRMLSWPNAADCAEIIAPFKKLKEEAKSSSFNLKVFNHSAISASNVASIGLTILQTLPQTKFIYWLSDRDDVTSSLDGIVYQMYYLNLHSFAEKFKLKPFHLGWFGDSQTPMHGKKMQPLPLSPFIRIPDYFAAPLAASSVAYQGIQFLEKEKYQRILSLVMADSPKFSIVRLVSDPGWAFKRIILSLTPEGANR